MTLVVSGLAKRFGATWALRDAGFSARPGELLALIGPNGSGKTTLLACAAGLVAADAGEVRLDGRVPTAAERRGALLYLPDGVAPWPDEPLSVLLDVVPRLLGAPRSPHAADIASALGLDAHRAQRLGALSKGQRKRALLAVALLAPHPYLLLDEPFDGLDLRQVREVAALLRRVAGAGRALVLSIHQLVDAARVADRLALLDGGRSVAEGTLDELRARAGEGALGGAADLESVFLALT